VKFFLDFDEISDLFECVFSKEKGELVSIGSMHLIFYIGSFLFVLVEVS
jgi:hypothetical protein